MAFVYTLCLDEFKFQHLKNFLILEPLKLFIYKFSAAISSSRIDLLNMRRFSEPQRKYAAVGPISPIDIIEKISLLERSFKGNKTSVKMFSLGRLLTLNYVFSCPG